MGLDCERIKVRSLYNRKFYCLLQSLLEIKIKYNDVRFTEFDGAMRYFSDSKEG